MELTTPAATDLTAELRAAFTAGFECVAGMEPHLGGALRQTLDHPGNLVRAWLLYGTARAYGLAEERAKTLAVAIEYFHTASLLFDDLPCMDDASQRRGEPCVHHTHGEAAAVLAALGLVSRAYGLLWRGLAGMPADRQALAGEYVEKCLGVAGLLNGQSEDLHYATLPGSRRSPQGIAAGKTVSLIRLALVLPALLAGAPARETRLLERLACAWGLAYQILDDLKDEFPHAHETGKTADRDRLLNRPNMALAIGPGPALELAARWLGLGDKLLARLPTLVFLNVLRRRFHAELGALKLASLSSAA